MPIYEYFCQRHGDFELIRSIGESALPGDCPHCQVECRRILSAPHIAGVPRAAMVAHETNERSQNEPRVSSHGHVCGAGCSHGASHESRQRNKTKPVMKRYTGARPWVVEHG